MPKPQQQSDPYEFLSHFVNSAQDNLKRASEMGNASIDQALKAAEVQVGLAKTMALVTVARAIEKNHNPSPGQSIRYGLEPLTQAVKALVAPLSLLRRR